MGFAFDFRRGVACASQLMEGLLEGMSVRDTDRVVWLDVIPNRQALQKLQNIR